MNRVGRVLFMYAETSVHAGTGQGTGYIDQAIQRDRATGFPIVQASGVKGTLRDHLIDGRLTDTDPEKAEKENIAEGVFGGPGSAGSMAPVDAGRRR